MPVQVPFMDLYEHLDKLKDDPFLDYCCDVRIFA